jgi:hypothetical protein
LCPCCRKSERKSDVCNYSDAAYMGSGVVSVQEENHDQTVNTKEKV